MTCSPFGEWRSRRVTAIAELFDRLDPDGLGRLAERLCPYLGDGYSCHILCGSKLPPR